MRDREVLFEFTVIGDTARIAAIDVETGVEAVTMGPVSAGQAALEALALRKLQKLMENASGPVSEEAGNAEPERPGKLV
jgi:hypothetical protein